MHAREWLSPATIIYVIDHLIKFSRNDPRVKRLLDNHEIYFLPVANPDGYQFSRTDESLFSLTSKPNTSCCLSVYTGLWRKTTSTSTSIEPFPCIGVDANRNFGVQWGKYKITRDPCSNQYAGEKAFSEPETKALADFVYADRQKWLAYFSIHSYSQIWLIPYSLGGGMKPWDYDELKRVAEIGISAMEGATIRRWKVWEAGNSESLTYQCTGTSDDWAKGVVGIKYSYTLELFPDAELQNYDGVEYEEVYPNRETTTSNFLVLFGKVFGPFKMPKVYNGFITSESEIPNSGREVVAALLASVEVMQIPVEKNQADLQVYAESIAFIFFLNIFPILLICSFFIISILFRHE